MRAIFTWGTHTETVMTPCLDDEERRLRLLALQAGKVELTEQEQQVLAAKRLEAKELRQTKKAALGCARKTCQAVGERGIC